MVVLSGKWPIPSTLELEWSVLTVAWVWSAPRTFAEMRPAAAVCCMSCPRPMQACHAALQEDETPR